jgi:hypothetical protein
VAQNQATPIPNQFVAGENPTEASGVSQTLAAAPTLGASGGALSDMAQKIASGYFLNPQNDPTFAGAADAAITPALRALQQVTLPQITGGSIGAAGKGTGGATAYGGAGGGTSQDIITQEALQNFGTNALNTTAQMANASRTAGMQLIPQAPGIAAGANQQLLAPAQATTAAGQQQQTYAQQAINNLLQQYQYQTQAPWQGLQQFGNLLTTGGFGNTTGTTDSWGTSTPSTPSMMTQILQGLTGGASAANSLFGAGPGGSASAASNLFGGITGALGSMMGPVSGGFGGIAALPLLM